MSTLPTFDFAASIGDIFSPNSQERDHFVQNLKLLDDKRGGLMFSLANPVILRMQIERELLPSRDFEQRVVRVVQL
jgi:hypothetical protein